MTSAGASEPASAAPAAARGFGGRGWFLACVGLLGIFAVAFQVMAVHAGFQPKKLPVPLRRELDQLDQKQLYPYVLLKPFAVSPEVLDALGTTQYVDWLLQDSGSADPRASEGLIAMFITYYTGRPDQVPHVPEVCYQGSGFREVGSSFHEVSIPALGPDFTVPVQLLEFARASLMGQQQRFVVYTFHVNGRFCRDRRQVQAVVGDLLERYAYFSKLELTFGTAEASPTREVALASAERFLRVLVPVLLREHWPDWDAVAGAGEVPRSQPSGPAGAPPPR